MKKQIQISVFVSLMSFSFPVLAQEPNKPVVQVATDELGEVTDSFQEHFFEALKQKAIENYEKAINSLVQCLALNSNEAVVYLELGKNFNALKEYNQAAIYLEKGRVAAPHNEGMLEELYNTYYLSEQFDKALPVVKELSVLNNSFSEDLVNLYIMNEEFDAALGLLDSLDQTRGSSTYREALRRQVYARTNNVAAQIEDLQQKITENPLDEQSYLNLIFVYSENSEAEKAFATAKKLLLMKPDSELVHLALYKFYMSEEKSDEAVNSMRILLGSRQIDEVTKYQALNDFLMYVTENPELENDLVNLVVVFSEDENNTKVYKQLGTFFLEKGNNEQALYYFDLALENDETGDFGLYREVLKMQLESQAYADAVKLSQQALDVFPTQAWLYFVNGIAHNNLSEFEKAVEMLETGLDFVIDNKPLENDFFRSLSKAYEGLGKQEKAAEYLKKVEQTENKKS